MRCGMSSLDWTENKTEKNCWKKEPSVDKIIWLIFNCTLILEFFSSVIHITLWTDFQTTWLTIKNWLWKDIHILNFGVDSSSEETRSSSKKKNTLFSLKTTMEEDSEHIFLIKLSNMQRDWNNTNTTCYAGQPKLK